MAEITRTTDTRLLQRNSATNGGSDEYQNRPVYNNDFDDCNTTTEDSIPQSVHKKRNSTPTKAKQATRTGKRLSRRIANRRILRQQNQPTPIITSPLVTPTPIIVIRAKQSAKDICTRKYGFACNPDLSNHTNLIQTLQACLHDRVSIDSAPRNRKVHNLCRDPTSVPPNVLHALGLGLGFCLSLERKDKNPFDFDRFRKAIRTHYTFRNHPPRKLKFPKLYVKRGDDWTPDDAPKKVEQAMDKFEKRTSEAFHTSRDAGHTYNLQPDTIQKLRALKKDQQFRVTATDKNLGPAIMEMDVYIR